MRLSAANSVDSYWSMRSTTQGPLAGRTVKAVGQQRDMHNALHQAYDNDDAYGDPHSSGLPV